MSKTLKQKVDTAIKLLKTAEQQAEKEEWRDVKGYEGRYQVSNQGRVMSLDYLHTGKHVVLKPKPYRGGYLQVCLMKNHKANYRNIHRLVYDAFIGIDKPYIRGGDGNKIWVINHKDEDKTNNRLENLELITQKENCNYGNARKKNSEKQKNNKKNSKTVYQYSKDFTLLKTWPSTRECNRNGFDCRRVSECCNKKGKKEDNREYKGFIWSYVEITC